MAPNQIDFLVRFLVARGKELEDYVVLLFSNQSTVCQGFFEEQNLQFSQGQWIEIECDFLNHRDVRKAMCYMYYI